MFLIVFFLKNIKYEKLALLTLNFSYTPIKRLQVIGPNFGSIRRTIVE